MNPMGKDEEDDRRNTSSMHADFDTQPFDETSSHSSGADDHEGQYFDDTVPFDGDGDGDEMLEAQVGGETQVLEIAGETQALDDDDETQLLDEGSESDGTQVLEDVDDDEGAVDDPHSADSKEILDESSCGHRMSQENSSASLPPRFTFLRAKSLRETALANSKIALKAQDETNPVIGIGQFSQEPPGVKDNGECFPGRSENKNKGDVGFSAVRKLFIDDLPLGTIETSLNSTDSKEGDGLDKLLIDHGELERLSYLNSQEPGELSQANALDFVDKFLKDNITEFDQEPYCVKKVDEKSKSLPSTKGKQSLAKRVTDVSKDRKAGIYDWDDNCEDEGGGDIFLRRKEDFFYDGSPRPRSMPGLQKTKLRKPNDDKDYEEQLSIPNKRKTAVHSDSRLGMHNLKIRNNPVREATRKLKRNLVDELDKQVNADCFRGEMEANANADGQEILDVGFDTQIAAEAMEALCNAGDIVDHASNVTTRVTRSRQSNKLSNSSTRKVGQCNKDNMMSRSKKSKLSAEGNQTSSANLNGRIVSSPIVEERKSARALKRHQLTKLIIPDDNDGGNGGSKQLQGELYHFTPVARRTRQSLSVNQSTNCDTPSKSLGKGEVGVGSLEKSSGIGLQASKTLDPKSTPGSSDHFEVVDNVKLCQLEKLAPEANALSVSNNFEMDTLDFPRRRRSLRINNFSNHDKGSKKLGGSSKASAQAEDLVNSTAGKRKMRVDSVVKSHVDYRTRSSSSGGSIISSTDRKQRKISTDNFEVTSSDGSPRDRYKSPDFTTASPANSKTPVNDASPVCMGDDYYKRSCNTKASKSCLLKVSRKELQRELRSLSAIRPELITPSKDSRKRKDMTDVRILYSHRLDEDIIKHQKKILARLGVSVVSSISDATHFVADQFVRTRNMLEAIAFGKPVVTHSWIESCGQASCFLDERNYILRDAKKEKEFGFSLPVSLARASEHPLLKGRRVLITPNTKPSKEIISSLVMAVQGQAVERVGRSAMKDHKIPDDLLILSCEEDYASCVPFLEKGAMVYSSELLLNGIVTQKLEYQRYRLFADHVKKTRSTIWLKRDDRTFVPVTKCT